MACQRQLASKCQRSFSHRSHPVRPLWGGNHGVTFQCTPPRPRALVNASCHHFPPFFFFFFFLGGRAIHYTFKDRQRNKPQVSNGRPSTAEAASYPHYLGTGRHKSLQRGNMSGKTSSPQGRCSPAHSQACSLSTNKASALSESTQHSCQDHNLKST